ncbi:MAG: class II glutamine amidotransferase [Myxococcales bacterium]|nr:class II glutamine amidotransferase [Myxococcales bacterium]
MSDLLGMSFDAAASPSIRIRGWADEEREAHEVPPTGWGFAWYPAHEAGAVVVKDPTPTGDTPLSRVLRDWERFRATIFVCHIRGAAKRASQENTHPFIRSYGKRDWLFAHNGQLAPRLVSELPLGTPPVFEPVGRTDSEHAFCWLLTKIRDAGARTLGEVGWERLLGWMGQLDSLGSFNALLTDGLDLVAYRDTEEFNSLHYIRRRPPHTRTKLSNRVVRLDLGHPLDINRTMVLFATEPVGRAEWTAMDGGEMVVARRGAIVWRGNVNDRDRDDESKPRVSGPLLERPTELTPNDLASAVAREEQELHLPALMARPSRIEAALQVRAAQDTTNYAQPRRTKASRLLRVLHETIYRYTEPVERSTHVFRLRPVHDVRQEVIEHSLVVSPAGESNAFEDVFGNQTLRTKVRNPYEELRITSRSLVRVTIDPPVAAPTRRTSIPLVWMPWQRQMMQAYLLPPELPETQLRELSEFAMGFVERQDYDLMETLEDINQSLREDFKYESKSTTLQTTPFEVYINRRGVCQDFANLFICLAQLLGVPARYRVGYVYTAANYDNQIQSEASHAWVELYLPWAGWRGYDPTNGCLANVDHVRVAVGRNYRDATPTSGTIYKGGKGETLEVSVRVEDIDEGGGGKKPASSKVAGG